MSMIVEKVDLQVDIVVHVFFRTCGGECFLIFRRLFVLYEDNVELSASKDCLLMVEMEELEVQSMAQPDNLQTSPNI